MKRILLVLALVSFAPGSVRPNANIGVDELEKLQGTWVFVSLEIEDAKVLDSVLSGSRLIIKRDRFNSINGLVFFQGTIEIDASQSPKTLDLISSDGPENGKLFRGIYDLGGEDLRICLSLGTRSRPTEFTAGRGSARSLATFKRANR